MIIVTQFRLYAIEIIIPMNQTAKRNNINRIVRGVSIQTISLPRPLRIISHIVIRQTWCCEARNQRRVTSQLLFWFVTAGPVYYCMHWLYETQFCFLFGVLFVYSRCAAHCHRSRQEFPIHNNSILWFIIILWPPHRNIMQSSPNLFYRCKI